MEQAAMNRGKVTQEEACGGARLVRASAAGATAGHGRHGALPSGFAGTRRGGRCAAGDGARAAADEALDGTAAGGAGVQLRLRHFLPPFEMAAAFAALVVVRGHGSSPCSSLYEGDERGLS